MSEIWTFSQVFAEDPEEKLEIENWKRSFTKIYTSFRNFPVLDVISNKLTALAPVSTDKTLFFSVSGGGSYILRRLLEFLPEGLRQIDNFMHNSK